VGRVHSDDLCVGVDVDLALARPLRQGISQYAEPALDRPAAERALQVGPHSDVARRELRLRAVLGRVVPQYCARSFVVEAALCGALERLPGLEATDRG
jgi:hypothetical protein